MTSYIKPQVNIHQQFAQSADAEESVLRAVIVGPNAVLHRYSDSSEKSEIALGEYPFETGQSYLYPSRNPGGIVDKEYSKLYVDDALLCYYKDLSQTSLASGSTPTVYNEPGASNIIRSTNLSFVENGESYPRSSAFGTRDVQIGDYVWLRSYTGTGTATSTACQYTTHLSKIIGFSPVMSDSAVGTVTKTGQTVTAETYSATGTLTATTNAPQFTLDASAYNALLAGSFNPTYTVRVTRIVSSVNCTRSVTVQVTSTIDDSCDELEIFEGEAFDIGAYGMKGTLTDNIENLSVGDYWTITGKSAYTLPTLTVSGTYTGEINDTYIVTVTKGGAIANSTSAPVVTIRTSMGLDYCSNIQIKDSQAHAYGGNGLSFAFTGSLFTGQTFTFPVTAANNGAIRGIILQNDLPSAMRSTSASNRTALDIRLLAKKNLVLSADNSLTPASDNFTQSDTQLQINGNIQLNDSEFLTSTGNPTTLELFAGNLYFEYREWVQDMTGELNYCDSLSAIDLIPGQLDSDNLLKYAVYKALSNSNGVSVGFVAVSNPDDSESWDDALSVLNGEDEVYTIVPLTHNISLLNKVATLIESESGSEQCRWKSGVFSLPLETTKMVVGQSSNSLTPTSTNGNAVMASFSDNPNETGNQYTKLSITSSNAKLIEYGVEAGDELRVILNQNEYQTYIVDSVNSDETLLVMSGPATPTTADVKIEIWHTLSKTEQAQQMGNRAQSFANRRIMVVAPDKVGEGGKTVPGYFVAAVIAGCKSGINAYQSLTHTEISGFDDYSAAKPYWTESQLDTLASYGVCILLETADGTPYVRHALTTDMTSTFTQEESITRDFDYVCKTLHSVLKRYIGKVNITDATLSTLETAIGATLDSLRSSQHIREYGDLVVQQHALLADKVEVYVDVTLPFPMNNIEVYITAQKG